MSELAQQPDAGVTGEAYCPHCFLQVATTERRGAHSLRQLVYKRPFPSLYVPRPAALTGAP